MARRVGRRMIFQTLTMPGEEVSEPPTDLPIDERSAMEDPGWPKMAFIERRLANDPTNWWAPNHAAVEAMEWIEGELKAATGLARSGDPTD